MRYKKKDKRKDKNTVLFTTISSIIMGLYIGYNVYIAGEYNSLWHMSYAIYVALLVLIKLALIAVEAFKYKFSLALPIRMKRSNAMLYTGFGLILVNLALIIPIIRLVLFEKEVIDSEVLIIVVATFTVLKVGMTVKNYVMSRNNPNLIVKSIRNIDVISTAVSALSLEVTMILVYSSPADNSMRGLVLITGLVVTILMILISLSTIIDSRFMHHYFKKQLNLQ